MPKREQSTSKPVRVVIKTPTQATISNLSSWELVDAKENLSEVVRRASQDGPQYITISGKPAVAIVGIEDLERLLPQTPRLPLVEFMETLSLGELNVERARDLGRDIDPCSVG